MTVKDLEVQFTILQDEFGDLKYKIDTLVEKYVILEKKYEKSMSKKRKTNFKCKKCGEKLETVKDLQNHKKENSLCKETFECDDCGKHFYDESKLNEHVKTHKTYSCDECDLEFKYEGILVKHMEAAHENNLYCHYYNNDKECPFDDQCIFLHDDSENCKYGKACERNLCMYKHEEN